MDLIVGFDPGTTYGLVLLDLNGNLILIESGKEKSINGIIRTIIKHGNPIAIGWDKKILNKKICQIATKLNLIIFKPIEDLKVKKKKWLIRKFFLKKISKKIKISNKHERDALVSALIALKQIKNK